MFNEKWCHARLTDSAQRICCADSVWAHDRGLVAVDSECFAMVALLAVVVGTFRAAECGGRQRGMISTKGSEVACNPT